MYPSLCVGYVIACAAPLLFPVILKARELRLSDVFCQEPLAAGMASETT